VLAVSICSSVFSCSAITDQSAATTLVVGVQRNQQEQEHWLNMNIYSSPAARQSTQTVSGKVMLQISIPSTPELYFTYMYTFEAQCVCCGVRIPAHVLTFVFVGCRCR
jgi:hypothetical protein